VRLGPHVGCKRERERDTMNVIMEGSVVSVDRSGRKPNQAAIDERKPRVKLLSEVCRARCDVSCEGMEGEIEDALDGMVFLKSNLGTGLLLSRQCNAEAPPSTSKTGGSTHWLPGFQSPQVGDPAPPLQMMAHTINETGVERSSRWAKDGGNDHEPVFRPTCSVSPPQGRPAISRPSR